MGLFGRKTEIRKDYNALIGDGRSETTGHTAELISNISDDILELTTDMVCNTSAKTLSAPQLKLGTLKPALKKKNTELMRRDKELLARQTELSDTQDQLNDTREALGDSQLELDGFRLELRRRKRELTSALDQMTFLRSRLGQAQTQLKTSRQEYQAQSVKLQDTEKTLEDEKDRHLETLSRLSKTRTKLEEAHNLLQESHKLIGPRKAESLNSKHNIETVRNELLETQLELSRTRDALEITQLKLTGLTRTKNKTKRLRRKIDELESDLSEANDLITLRDQTIQEISAENFGYRAGQAEQIEQKEAEYKSYLMKARNELIRRRDKDREQNAEITLVNAKNRALTARLKDLTNQLDAIQPRRDIIPAALSQFQEQSGEVGTLVNALEKSRANEVQLSEQIEKAEEDMAMMEDVNAMLRNKFAAFARPAEDSIEIPRWNRPD